MTRLQQRPVYYDTCMESPPYGRSAIALEVRRILERSNVQLTAWEVVEEPEKISDASPSVDLSDALQLVRTVIEELKASGETEETAGATTFVYNWLPPLLRNS